MATSAPTINASFLAPAVYDLAGAADRGTYILNWRDAVYDFSGTKLAPWVAPDSSWCPRGSMLGDPRIMYDHRRYRWIVTALCIFGPRPATNVIAVSKTADPRLSAGWYVYNFPACGAFDTRDGSDQPHAGYNESWIAVDSACSADPVTGVNGAGLAVFDKFNLYKGRSLVLNKNWWQFVDPGSGGPYNSIGGGNGTRNHSARTYDPTINRRQDLTTSLVDHSGRAQVVYSHVEGPANYPVYYPTTQVVTTSFSAIIGNPNCFDRSSLCVGAPGCTGCMRSVR